ncbi:hypothetical protein, partial [Stenotrophomonas maltophilia]|uniref:hypothetical protein n=1 Tax=Stenotrophomonas maltophilia TaxID=40324 RepID=UPI001953F2F5
IGTAGNDVILAGGGGDYVDAGAGSDTIVYAKHDGDLWIKDVATSTSDVDRLVLTDLKVADVSFGRIADSLQ